jgi:hypothetical protein
VSVSHYSFETVELFKEVMTRVSRERSDSLGKVSNCQPPEIDTCIIELHFRQLANESDRRFFNSVRTSLQLPSKTVDRLRELAAHELSGNREFKRLVTDLRSQASKPHSPNGQSLASGVRE